MEGEGCVLAEKDIRWGPGRGDLEPQPEERGLACLGNRNVQEAGDGPELGTLCRGPRD